jgi:hypothetical protein
MSFFGKKQPADPAQPQPQQPPSPQPTQPQSLQPQPHPHPHPHPQPQPQPTPAPAPSSSLYNGPRVDIPAIYRQAKLSPEELDRVVRAEELLKLLPSSASRTREVVDATFRAFGVDRTTILNAASKQLEALETFVRFSHEQTQRTLDAGAKRIAELEAEIAKCRQVSAQATSEGEERARVVNEVLLKLEKVIDFFGDEAKTGEFDLDADTVISKPDDPKATAAKLPPKSTQPPPVRST